MTIPELPWWPPTSSDNLTEDHVRHLFRYLKPRTPSIMAEGERRIREVVGPDAPITVHHPTIRSLAGRRLGQLDVLSVISLRAGRPLERQARFLIGVSLDREGAIMVTPNLNPATHLVWERWAMSPSSGGG